MADKISKEQRSRNMARVKNKNTKPEMIVRKTLHRLGYRFRLHRQDLPGSPDIVLPRHRKVIFVHGCFWHGHNCPRGKRPSTNQDFWDRKLDKNIERDVDHRTRLDELNWEVLTVWECEIKDLDIMKDKLIQFMQEE